MSANYRCSHCDTSYKSSELLKNHRAYMRRAGKLVGHELKAGESIAVSKAGSQVDPKEKKKMDDFNGIDLPMERFVKD
jgi:hypothetical protein